MSASDRDKPGWDANSSGRPLGQIVHYSRGLGGSAGHALFFLGRSALA